MKIGQEVINWDDSMKLVGEEIKLKVEDWDNNFDDPREWRLDKFLWDMLLHNPWNRAEQIVKYFKYRVPQLLEKDKS